MTQWPEAVHVENEAPSRIPETNARSNAGLRLIDDVVHPVVECLQIAHFGNNLARGDARNMLHKHAHQIHVYHNYKKNNISFT